MRYEVLAGLLGATVFASSGVAAPVQFFSDPANPNSAGNGLVDGQSFTWSASAANVNAIAPAGDVMLGWGDEGNGGSQNFDFDINLEFPGAWTFQSISFSALNPDSFGDNAFSVTLLDASGNAIDSQSLSAVSTNGLAASGWSYDAVADRWLYDNLAGSVNGHEATLTGSIAGVSDMLIDIDDHVGVDRLTLDVAIPAPGSLAVLAAGGLLASRRRR